MAFRGYLYVYLIITELTHYLLKNIKNLQIKKINAMRLALCYNYV